MEQTEVPQDVLDALIELEAEGTAKETGATLDQAREAIKELWDSGPQREVPLPSPIEARAGL